MPVSHPKIAVATLATVATVSGAVVAAPTASAWTTSYDAEAGKCTISFSESEQRKLNTAWKTLFEAMAENTENETLKDSFANAAENPVLDAATVTVKPEEAQANGGLYGLDVYALVLPYGAGKAIENIGVDDIVENIDWDAALAQIDLDAVVTKIDWDAALDNDGDGQADVDTAKVVKSLPMDDLASNMLKAVMEQVGVDTFFKATTDPATFASILKQVSIPDLAAKAVNALPYDEKKKAVKDAFDASGVDTDQVIENISRQQPVRDAAKAELKKVDYKTLLLDALTKAGKKPSVDLVLGYSPSEVLAAASAAFKEVGPAVTAPILTARPAFTNCAAPQEGQSFTPASGSVVSGSSNLDLKGLAIVAVLGLVATLLASGAAGFALRPAYDQFIAQFL